MSTPTKGVGTWEGDKEKRKDKSKMTREPLRDGKNKPKGSDLEKAKKKKIKTKKMEKFLGLGGSSTSGQEGGTSQGTKGVEGGTGDIKTNLGSLLGGK